MLLVTKGHEMTLTLPRFGVEIEFVDGPDRYEVADALNDAGLTAHVEDYNHSVREHWKVTTDSSCGLELVSPPLHWHQRLDVRRAITVLRDLEAEVNVDCGFHVHHEWPWWGIVKPDEALDRLVRLRVLYRSAEPLLRHLLAPSRWDDNRFCQWDLSHLELYCADCGDYRMGPCPDHDPDEIERNHLFVDRYVTVNMTALDRQGTVEFRQHQGTLNHSKALAWVELTRAWTHAASRPLLTPPERAEYAFDKLTTSTWSFLRSRCADNLEDLITQTQNNITRDLEAA